ncbi:MAG: sugar porter family MFS transporter [Bacteroidota bacterium]|nr:sugar porter family MFS transporter [Bacteroidota bacterium]
MNKRFLNWVTFVAINGGLLFGLNMAGISGAIPFLRDYFVLDDIALGLAVGSIMIGCLVGSLFAGSLSDKYGRKAMMIITAVLFMVSALGCSLTSSLWFFVASRIIAGIAVGAASVLGPTYISEIAPAERRGTLVSFNQLAIVIGILLSYIIDYAFVNLDNGWRYMLGVPFVFGLINLIFLLISFPESPRWLAKVGKLELTHKILEKVGGKTYADKELNLITTSLNNQTSDKRVKIKDLFRGRLAYVVLLGTLLAAFQQITGINAVVNYAPTIFQQTGVGSDTALLQSIIVGFVNFVFTIVAVRLVDKLGRKTLLLWGAGGMAVSLAYLALAFTFHSLSGLGVLISLLSYIAFMAASLSPVMWVVTSEMYPTRYRGVAMSFSTAVSWACALLVVQFFPWMLHSLGGMVSFGIFGGFSLLAFIFIKVYIPETKGKTLEQIESDLGLVNVE